MNDLTYTFADRPDRTYHTYSLSNNYIRANGRIHTSFGDKLQNSHLRLSHLVRECETLHYQWQKILFSLTVDVSNHRIISGPAEIHERAIY